MAASRHDADFLHIRAKFCKVSIAVPSKMISSVTLKSIAVAGTLMYACVVCGFVSAAKQLPAVPSVNVSAHSAVIIFFFMFIFLSFLKFKYLHIFSCRIRQHVMDFLRHC